MPYGRCTLDDLFGGVQHGTAGPHNIIIAQQYIETTMWLVVLRYQVSQLIATHIRETISLGICLQKEPRFSQHNKKFLLRNPKRQTQTIVSKKDHCQSNSVRVLTFLLDTHKWKTLVSSYIQSVIYGTASQTY